MVRVNPKVLGLLVCLVPLLPHLPALDAGFTYDDQDFVEDNASVRSIGEALAHFLSPFPPHQPARALYRPLTALSYAVDQHIAGSAQGRHAFNLLYYFLTLVLVFIVARRYLRSDFAAAAVVLFFGLHPVHAEAVDSISGRSELLALLCLLFTLACYHRFQTTPRRGLRALWLALATTGYACSTLAKESGLVFLGVLLAHIYFFPTVTDDGQRPAAHRPGSPYLSLIPFIIVAALYLCARSVALGGRFGPDTALFAGANVPTRLFTAGAVFLEYMRLLVFPGTLQVDPYYSRTVGLHHSLSLQAALGLTLLLLLLAGLGLLSRRARRTTRTAHTNLAAFALWAFFVLLLPVSHIIPFGALMAERLLYAPSFAFVLLLVGLLHVPLLRVAARGWRARLTCEFLVVSLCVLLGCRTYLRAREWRDEVVLWESAIAAGTEDVAAYNNLGTGYSARGDFARARAAFERSLALSPGHVPALNNLGFLLMQTGQTREAQEVFFRALRSDPRNYRAWNDLGVIAARQLDHSRARMFYQRALDANPTYLPARTNLRESERIIALAHRDIAQARPGIDSVTDPARVERFAQACYVVGDYRGAQIYLDRARRNRGPASSRSAAPRPR